MTEKATLYRILRPILVAFINVCYRPTVRGKENIIEDEGVIYVGNHKHAMDPLVLASRMKSTVHFLAKKELYWGPLKYFFLGVGTIPIDRNRKNPKSMAAAEQMLKDGCIIGIFPEGTRNRTNQVLLPFKYGAVSLAKKTGVKIVPFAIKGTYRYFRKGLEIEFGKPIDIQKMELEEANRQLMKKVTELLQSGDEK